MGPASVPGMSISWAQALAWRLGRQLLDPVGTASVAAVVGRLGAVPAQHDDAAELAVRTRRTRSRPGEVAAAVADGSVVKVFAFRGATHLMTPEDAGTYLALRASSRKWELPSWQEHYGLAPGDWPALRETVRQALAKEPLTRDELRAAVTAVPRFAHLGFAFDDGAATLLKPFCWQGDMGFGPPRDGRATFQGLAGNPRWAGVPDVEDAGPRAVTAYFRAYGPATPGHVHYWLGAGLGAARKRITAWIDGLGDRLARVAIDGEDAWLLREDLDDLRAATPSEAVRLLPGHDQWVLGPGTKDEHVVPPAHRQPVTRGRNLVLAGGVVAGTWAARKDRLEVTWFAGPHPLDDEVDRLAGFLGRPLEAVVTTG